MGGLSGWQWLFIFETVPSLALGIITLFYLDDRVASAEWLNAEEKRIIVDQISREEKEELSHLGAAFKTGRVWLLGLIYFCLASGIYIISFWLPTIIKQSGVSNPLHIGMLTAIPYVAAIIAMIAVNTNADRTRERRWHVVMPGLVTALGLALSAWFSRSTPLAMTGLVLATAEPRARRRRSGACQPPFWAAPPLPLASRWSIRSATSPGLSAPSWWAG